MAKPWEDYDVYDVRFRLLHELPGILQMSDEQDMRQALDEAYRRYPDREVDFVIAFLNEHLLPALQGSIDEAYDEYLRSWRRWGRDEPRIDRGEFDVQWRRCVELLEKEWAEGLLDEEEEEQFFLCNDLFLDARLFADWEPSQPPPEVLEEDYPPPYDKLLELDEEHYPQSYNRIAALGDEAVPTLIQMATDKALYWASRDSPLVWASLHAVRTLTEIGAPEAVEPLMYYNINIEDEWLHEELPDFFAAVGEPAIEPLVEYASDESQDWYPRAGAVESLKRIAEEHPDQRERVISILRQQLRQRDVSPDMIAFIISALANLNAEETLPDIQQAFGQGRVATDVIDLDTVDMIMGKKPWPWEQEEATRISPAKDLGHDLGRNDPCWCGSGKKYKFCHWAEDRGY